MKYSNAFLWAVDHTLTSEGVFSDHAWDPGGATKYGITAAKAAEHGYKVRDLTVPQAVAIYYADYWAPGRLDQLRSVRVAAEVFDTAVNMQGGVTRGPAIRFVQEALNAFGERVEVDGVLGPATRAAVNRVTKKYEEQFLHALNGFQFMRYLELKQRDHRAAERAFNGWMLRLKVHAAPDLTRFEPSGAIRSALA